MRQTLYVPLMNSAVRPDTRGDYLPLLAALGADCIFLAVDRAAFYARDGARQAYLDALAENLDFFRQNGYRVGIWTQAFGFGDRLSDAARPIAANYIPLRSVTGREKPGHDMFCPESPAFLADYTAHIRDLAALAPDLLMLDDDLCLSVRPGIGCFCPRHLALLEEKLGESLDGADLPALFFTGGRNRYRDAWHSVMGDTLRRFARAVRAAADAVNPDLRVGFCAGYTSWDIEGIDALSLTRILAGKNQPFLRFSGAPYWSAESVDRFAGQPLCAIIEETRAQEAFCRNSGVELFCEADSYPRPRYAVPSSLIEGFSFPLRASGGMGELGYFFDYHATPAYETGYVRHRLHNRPLCDFIDAHFAGKSCRGVRVYHTMAKIVDAELPSRVDEKAIMAAHFNRGAELLGLHCIPTVYDAETDCGIAFGEEARHLDRLPPRLILDADAARILQERGIDIGFARMTAADAPQFEWFGGEKVLLTGGSTEGWCHAELSPGAVVLSEFESPTGRRPAAYIWQSGESTFLVLTFAADRIPHRASVLRSYARGRQLAEFCGSLSRIDGAPGVYTICKSGQGQTALLFVNLHADPILDGIVTLDADYRCMTLCGAEGKLDGRRITLTAPVPPYGAFAVLLET